jgi:hypothetical protein
MVEAVYRIQTLVVLKEGMRLFYDCPSISGESFEADNFFRKYQGKTGVIAGFPTTLVGPFDEEGRLPGTYLTPYGIHVRFDGEEKVNQDLNLDFFVLLDPTITVTNEEFERAQRSGDLPNPILFYPGDKVREQDDLLQVPRVVQEVGFDEDGEVLYVLAKTSEAHCLPKTETTAINLVLIERGQAYDLYNDPSKLSFGSAEEELRFWSQDGLSVTFYGSEDDVPEYERSLAEVRKCVEQGEGDLILASERISIGERQVYTVRILHGAFAEHRERVRKLALETEPPAER